MTSAHANNLAEEEPRPMDATIDGYAWLPRMIDKARAAKAGTLGEYYRYPCPIDQTCLGRLGIDADTFAQIADSVATDHDVIHTIRDIGARTAKEAWFDPVRLNEERHNDAS